MQIYESEKLILIRALTVMDTLYLQERDGKHYAMILKKLVHDPAEGLVVRSALLACCSLDSHFDSLSFPFHSKTCR